MSDPEHWNERYRDAVIPWDTGHPSSELKRVVAEEQIAPCRALEMGCGTGVNSVWLAQQGFDVTSIDLSSLAVEMAQLRARDAGVTVRFIAADVLDLPDLGEPFHFFFDRGCYHVVRRDGNAEMYTTTVAEVTAENARGLVLAGNAKEPHDPGPPTVSEDEIRAEWGKLFNIQWLNEIRFDTTPSVGVHFLAWSIMLQKKPR